MRKKNIPSFCFIMLSLVILLFIIQFFYDVGFWIISVVIAIYTAAFMAEMNRKDKIKSQNFIVLINENDKDCSLCYILNNEKEIICGACITKEGKTSIGFNDKIDGVYSVDISKNEWFKLEGL